MSVFGQFAAEYVAVKKSQNNHRLKFWKKLKIMAINAEHASEILRRIFNSEDPSEQITLISGKDKRR